MFMLLVYGKAVTSGVRRRSQQCPRRLVPTYWISVALDDLHKRRVALNVSLVYEPM
jgi:hypothetical protein